MQIPSNTPAERGPATSDADPHMAGDVIAEKYRLENKIGEGGMGTVWTGTNTVLETQVALKILRPGAHVGATERMLREARAAASLSHPAIVRVFDFGIEPDGAAYIVMELLEGESLRGVLKRQGRLAPEQAVQLLLPVAEGLAVAHARGIVHRDLKPDNIFLAVDDTGRVQPKIVDFGIAKILRPSAGRGVTGVSVVGTPEYMSPEQAVGDDVDERADVWGLSVVLHELLTDEYIFDGESVEQVLRAVVHAPTPSLVDKAGVDQALWSIVERGLRKRRNERWSSALEMSRALATWLLHQGVDEDATGASIRHSWLDLPTPPRSGPRRTAETSIGVGPELELSPTEPGADTAFARPAGVPASWSSIRIPRLRGRAARLTAVAAVALTLGSAWVMARSNAVADEPSARGLAVAPRDDLAQRAAAASSADAEQAQQAAVAECAPPRAPAATSASAAAPRPARPATPPSRRSSAESVDFGF